MIPPVEPCWAWIDESGSNSRTDPGSYILAAAVCPVRLEGDVREVMMSLNRAKFSKLHWHDESAVRRSEIVSAICGLGLDHLVVVRAHHPEDRPERRRRKCLELLVPYLEGLGITNLVLESRGPADDGKDISMFNALRSQHRISTSTRAHHVIGRTEPMLAIPDAVCGAITAARVGDQTYQTILDPQLTILES